MNRPFLSTIRASVAAALVAGSLAFFVHAPAASAGELESRSLFAEGRRLRTAGQCADAIVLFHKALETFPDGLGALRNAAECEEETGKLASARRDYWDLRLAVLRSTSPKYEGWDKDAEAAHAALSERVPRLTLRLVGDRPEGLRVQLNGQPFDLRLLGVELEEDVGPITIEVFEGGPSAITRKLQATEKTRQTVDIQLHPVVKTRAQATSTPHDGAPPQSGAGKGMRIGGGIALGVGGASLVGALAALGVRQSALSSVDAVCPTHKRCPSSVADDVSRGKTASTLVDVFAVTAAVGTGLGLTLVLAAPKSAPAETRSVGLVVRPGGLSIEGSFQ